MLDSVNTTALHPRADDGAITVQEWVYRQLKERILTGQFVPGRSVTLRGIAAMLEVSPTPVREALRRLVSERALEVHGNRRVSVPTMTRRKFDDLCAVRVSLETLAAERAMPHIDAGHLERLRRLDAEVDEAVENGEINRYLHRHREFHFSIYELGSAEVLMPLIESVWLQFSPFLRLVVSHIGVDYIVDRHADALNALERQDHAALRFAIEADVREGLGSLTESEWRDLDAATRKASDEPGR
ncbi:GntR family transcriptional regulator [Halofilum ochraceum]|uniref:GntR family transcriptional regulator n=1 Tax=Halofilum ochraceum TaxID=1611323 RepID=UPI0008D94E38|nr:GntR family transcriptional regulator [Halofilum ochraceum]